MGAARETYVRNDNSDALYQVGPVNTVANEKRLNGFPEREMRERNEWSIVGYILGDTNTPDGLANSLSSVNLRRMLS